MLEHIVDGFLSQMGLKLADFTHSTVTTRKNYRQTLESLDASLKRLSAKASDFEVEIRNAELLGKKKRKQAVDLWLMEVQKLGSKIEELLHSLESEGFISKFFGGDRSIELRETADKLFEESQHLGELLLDICGIPGMPFLSRRLVGKQFEESFRKIWKFLMVDRVSSIGIHGMGGSGKTSLAKHIHNQLLKEPNECVFWITVSQVFMIKNMQDEFSRLVGLNLADEHNEDKRAARLNHVLSQKKNFVLILDDVWRKINLKKLGDPLSVQGGKLIITTRSSDVCDQIGCKKVLPVNILNKSEAWELFTITLGEEMTSLTPQIEEIAKDMAGKCGGLPLAIITLAGSMKGKNDDHEWRNASEELNELIMSENGDEEEKVFEILKYSFDQLDRGEEKHSGYTKLQKCFLYCSLYPEDHKIGREELIEQFISEELLDTNRSRRKRIDQGHVLLNKLVNVCLLESDETRRWVKMHDLIRAMALKITKGRYMRIERQQYELKEFQNEELWTEELEKVSLMQISDLTDSNSSLLNIPAEWTPNCPKLSTLLLQGNKCFEVIPPDSFFWMHNLHVLNLSFTQIKELPHSLSNLRSLRSLLLCRCYELKYVPYLGNLKELREMSLSHTCIEEVPQGMEELTNLECLKIDAPDLKSLPRNLLLKFPKLQCLYLPLGIAAPVIEIESLKHLEEFCGRVKDVFDFSRLMGCHTSFKEYNRSYYVEVGEYIFPRIENTVDKEVKLKTHLTLEGWTNAMFLAPDIKVVVLENCSGLSNCCLDDLQRLNVNLKPLNRLYIKHCKGIECVFQDEQIVIEEGESKTSFENLGAMELKGLPDFIGVMISQRAGVAAALQPPIFSSLKVLTIVNCNKMKTMGLPLWEVHNLEEMEVRFCEEVEEIIQVADEFGVGNEALPIVHLPKLKKLYLEDLRQLKSICRATMVCSSIESIKMLGCVGLNKLPIVFGHPEYDSPPSALQVIALKGSEKEWWESLELEHPSLRLLLQSFIYYPWP